MLGNDWMILGRQPHAMQIGGPFNKDFLRRQVEGKIWELGEVARRCAPCCRIESSQCLEYGEGAVAGLTIWRPVAPFPLPMIGIDETLEPLEHPVVR